MTQYIGNYRHDTGYPVYAASLPIFRVDTSLPIPGSIFGGERFDTTVTEDRRYLPDIWFDNFKQSNRRCCDIIASVPRHFRGYINDQEYIFITMPIYAGEVDFLVLVEEIINVDAFVIVEYHGEICSYDDMGTLRKDVAF